MIGVIIPLIQEAAVFNPPKSATRQPIQISDNLLLFISGIGEENATNAVEVLAPKVSHLISWGTAAGLNENLQPGDLLLPDLISDKNQTEYLTDSSFKNKLVKSLADDMAYESGLLCESTSVLKDEKEKEDFHRQTKALACDMESATIARLASQKNIPFNAIRVVADDYWTGIPQAVHLSIDKNGGFSVVSFLFKILLRPGDIGKVVRLARNFSKAKKTMQVLKEVLIKF